MAREEVGIAAEFTTPDTRHFVDARKLGVAVEGLRRVMDPSFVTPTRQLVGSLALRLANPYLPLEEVARHSNLPLDLLEEDLAGVQETFQWATNRLGLGCLMGPTRES